MLTGVAGSSEETAMHIARIHVRNILLTLVVVCAFVIDARTARAATVPWPGCLPAALDGAAAGSRGECFRSGTTCPGPTADIAATGRPARA